MEVAALIPLPQRQEIQSTALLLLLQTRRIHRRVVSTILPLLSNEEIKITASKLDSAGYSGIILFAQTVNSYTCLSNSPYLTV